MQGDRGWTALAGRDNALNAIRLILAALVLLAHSWSLSGAGSTQATRAIGEFAVDCFFVISGYLIAGSRLRLGMGDFLWRRVLRIGPGYWVCLLVVAFAIVPVSTLLTSAHFDATDAAGWVWSNSALHLAQPHIGDTLTAAPDSSSGWNGQLWSIGYEFACYIVAGALLSLRWFRAKATAVLLAALTVMAAGHFLFGAFPWAGEWLRVGPCFAAGALLRLLGWAITGRAAAMAALLLVASLTIGYWLVLIVQPIPLAVVVLWAGARWRARLGAVNDVSYGVYIYGQPVQLLLALAGVGTLGVAGFFVASMLAVLPLAWASWVLVERPASRLRRFPAQSGTIQPTWSHQIAPDPS